VDKKYKHGVSYSVDPKWVDHTVNMMKHNLLHEEFVEIVKLLAEKFNG
jgi:hypothetical protein